MYICVGDSLCYMNMDIKHNIFFNKSLHYICVMQRHHIYIYIYIYIYVRVANANNLYTETETSKSTLLTCGRRTRKRPKLSCNSRWVCMDMYIYIIYIHILLEQGCVSQWLSAYSSGHIADTLHIYIYIHICIIICNHTNMYITYVWCSGITEQGWQQHCNRLSPHKLPGT